MDRHIQVTNFVFSGFSSCRINCFFDKLILTQDPRSTWEFLSIDLTEMVLHCGKSASLIAQPLNSSFQTRILHSPTNYTLITRTSQLSYTIPSSYFTSLVQNYLNLNKFLVPYRFRQYGLWERYADLYRNDDLRYIVGVSDYTRDWFFAQVTRYLINSIISSLLNPEDKK